LKAVASVRKRNKTPRKPTVLPSNLMREGSDSDGWGLSTSDVWGCFERADFSCARFFSFFLSCLIRVSTTSTVKPESRLDRAGRAASCVSDSGQGRSASRAQKAHDLVSRPAIRMTKSSDTPWAPACRNAGHVGSVFGQKGDALLN